MDTISFNFLSMSFYKTSQSLLSKSHLNQTNTFSLHHLPNLCYRRLYFILYADLLLSSGKDMEDIQTKFSPHKLDVLQTGDSDEDVGLIENAILETVKIGAGECSIFCHHHVRKHSHR